MHRSILPTLCATLVCTSLASAQEYTVIYSNVSGLPSALVPGMGGLEFNAGTNNNSAFDRPFRSPNGNWILTATMETTSFYDDEVIMINGVVTVREGDLAPYDASGHGSFDTQIAINDAGQFAFATNTTASANDDYIILADGLGGFTVIAQEGAPIPTLPGNTYDDTLDSTVLQADGTVGFSADGVDGTVPSTQDDLLILGANLLEQEGVTIPPGQVGSEFIENFDSEDFYVSTDGLHWICQGDLTGASSEDDIVLVDGTVILQEGITIVPGTDGNVIDGNGIGATYMDPGNNWYVRGRNETNDFCWVLRNGVLIAKTGDPITPSSTEVWNDAVFMTMTGNTVGDYLVGGSIGGGSILDFVLVKNGTEVVARAGDPVDLDGNGLLDDDAFIYLIGYDDSILLDDGTLRFVCSLKDGAGTAIANVLLEIDTTSDPGVAYCAGDGLGTSCPCANNNNGAMGGCDWGDAAFPEGGVLAATGSASIGANNTNLIATGISNNFGVFFGADNQVNGGNGNPLNDGLRCAGGGLVRLIPPTMASGNQQSTPAPVQTLDLGAAAGVTRRYQYWFRTPAGPCGQMANLTNGLEIVWGS